MNKQCAKCTKTVYPLEEIKCLDKVWHKSCFRCQECSMTLSMKTYKGFDKLPYCDAHIPKVKATAVAETPEFRRLSENTKIQSNVQYHAEFEKNKAKFTTVDDDPETNRLKKNSKIISNVSYHGELERKAQMEQRRSDPNDEDQPRQNFLQPMPSRGRGVPMPQDNYRISQPPPQQHQPQRQQLQQYEPQQPPSMASPVRRHAQETARGSMPPPYHLLAKGQPDPNHNSPYSARTSQTLIYSSAVGPVQQQPKQSVGSIVDYDPMNNRHGAYFQQQQAMMNNQQHQAMMNNQQQHAMMNNYYKDSPHANQAHGNKMYSDPAPSVNSPVQYSRVSGPPTQLGLCYRAVYDYEAADGDEISFRDGDIIINCTAIDDGWMTGTVQRTGRTGMLPANYVARV